MRKRKPEGHGTSAPTVLLLLARAHGYDPAEVEEEYSERAAVREYVGGQTREVAEAGALGDVADVLRRRYRRLF